MTRLGGSSNCLTVIVTRSRFAVTSFFPFTALSGIYDLEHLVPLSEIAGIVPQGKVTEVEFPRSDRTCCRLSLRLRDTAGFLSAVQNHTDREKDSSGEPAP